MPEALERTFGQFRLQAITVRPHDNQVRRAHDYLFKVYC